jgi:hypothetical protein
MAGIVKAINHSSPFTCEKQGDCKTDDDDGSAQQARDQSNKAKEQAPKDRHLTSCES